MKTNKKFYYSVLWVSGLVIFFVLGMFFFLRELGRLENKLVSLRETLAEIDFETENIKSLENILEARGDDINLINSAFIDEKSLIRFIEDIENVAVQSGIVLKVESASPANAESRLGPGFQVSASGDFENLFKYLFLLENMPYQISLENVSFGRRSRDENTGRELWNASYNLRLISYIF